MHSLTIESLPYFDLNTRQMLFYWANLQFSSREMLKSVAEERLRQQIARSSTQIRSFFSLDSNSVSCLDDLSKLPIRTAQEIWETQQKTPPFGIYNNLEYDQIRSSKGSTGFQKFWPFTNHFWALFMIGKVRMLLAMGVNSNDLLASLDVGSTPLGIKSTVDAAAMCLDVKILPIGSSSIQSKVKLILNCRPSVIVGLPDEIVTIGKIISNCNITNPITKIISVGKSILPYYQDLKKYYPNSLIQNDIGSSELSQLIFTCPEGNQHVNIDLTHIVLNSENEIIATGLTSANPIFNYKTGDRLDGLEYGNCGCGSFLPMTNGFVERRKC